MSIRVTEDLELTFNKDCLWYEILNLEAANQLVECQLNKDSRQGKGWKLWPQEAAYFIMVIKEDYEERILLLHEIFLNLTNQGYDTLPVINFYISLRKKSKLLCRFRQQIGKRVTYSVYKNSNDYHKEENPELVQFLSSDQPVMELMEAESEVSIYCIGRNHDYVFLRQTN